MMMLVVIDVLKVSGVQFVVNIKFIFDSEEEKGLLLISKVMQVNCDLLCCDVIVIYDGFMYVSNLLIFVFGNCGVVEVCFIVYGGKVLLYSGYYGNYVCNLVQQLVNLLVLMKNDEGWVMVLGYYDYVKISEVDCKIMVVVFDDQVVFNKCLGIVYVDKVGVNYQEVMQYLLLNVCGMVFVVVGDKVVNIVFDKVFVELDLCIMLDFSVVYFGKFIEQYIECQGYYFVKNVLIDEECSCYDKLVMFMYQSEGVDVVGLFIDLVVGIWVYKLLIDIFGVNLVLVCICMMGGIVFIVEIVGVLQVFFVIIFLVNVDNNQYVVNENFWMGNYVSGVCIIYGLLMYLL